MVKEGLSKRNYGQGRTVRNHLMRAVLFSLLITANAGLAMNATVPRQVSTPYPTLTNLAVEWVIEGDDNLNGRVEVSYRRTGESRWLQGMPLRRIPAGENQGVRHNFLWRNKHSGSIFDLRPGTEYEIRLRLHDPDGGAADTTLQAGTRPVPRAWPDGRIIKVNPDNIQVEAINAQPGDILLLAPGYYGDFTVPCSGEPGKPVVFRSDRSHEVINSTFDSISLLRRQHVILEGLTVNGTVDLLHAEEVAVRYCTVNAKFGIVASSAPGARNCYIADNLVTYSIPWTKMGMGSQMVTGGGANQGEGIQITGPGNVICYNRVKGFRDCISTMEGADVFEQKCIDIYNNDIYVGADDGIEADFCMDNCRIMRNRITNCTMGLSSQPGLGGPTYFIRNVMYNLTHSPFKLSRGSRGDVLLHNTVLKVGDGYRVVHNPQYVYSRNNLALGGSGGGPIGKYDTGTGLALFFPAADSTCDLDYDGLGVCGTPFGALIGGQKLISLEQLRKSIWERHAIGVTMDVFASRPPFPDPPVPEREVPDLRLKTGSAAVDAGVVIPGVNDKFAGKAPDLGAYELGQALPHYGPRPAGVDEETLWEDK